MSKNVKYNSNTKQKKNNYNKNKRYKSNYTAGGNKNKEDDSKSNNHNANHNKKYRHNNKKYKYNKPQTKSIEELEKDYLLKKKNSEVEKPICQICKEEIYIVEQAINYKHGEGLCHFDCVLKELMGVHQLDKFETIVYLGGGTFGIIKTRKNSRGKIKFFVRKRIVYEKKDFYDYKLEE